MSLLYGCETMKGIKCSLVKCNNPGLGYFTGTGGYAHQWGLILCHLHKAGKMLYDIKEIMKKNPELIDTLNPKLFKKFKHECEKCHNAEVWAKCYWDNKALCKKDFDEAWEAHYQVKK